MIRIALDYLRLLNNPQIKFRFDIVEVLLREDAQKPDDIRVITNAFDLPQAVYLLRGPAASSASRFTASSQ